MEHRARRRRLDFSVDDSRDRHLLFEGAGAFGQFDSKGRCVHGRIDGQALHGVADDGHDDGVAARGNRQPEPTAVIGLDEDWLCFDRHQYARHGPAGARIDDDPQEVGGLGGRDGRPTGKGHERHHTNPGRHGRLAKQETCRTPSWDERTTARGGRHWNGEVDVRVRSG